MAALVVWAMQAVVLRPLGVYVAHAEERKHRGTWTYSGVGELRWSGQVPL